MILLKIALAILSLIGIIDFLMYILLPEYMKQMIAEKNKSFEASKRLSLITGSIILILFIAAIKYL